MTSFYWFWRMLIPLHILKGTWAHTLSRLIIIIIIIIIIVGRDSSVGIATRYRLDGPGIKSRWEARFSAPVQTGPEAHPASYTRSAGSVPGVKRPGRGAEHPHPSSAEVRGRLELYLYSLSWLVLGWNFLVLYNNNNNNYYYYYYTFQQTPSTLMHMAHIIYHLFEPVPVCDNISRWSRIML